MLFALLLVASPSLVITEPSVLRGLEARGGSFGERAFSLPRATSAMDALAETPEWRSITSVIAHELDEIRSADPRAGVGMRHTHRMFDARWLSSALVRFELTGIVNRIDRRPFAPGTCGELRFIYRLAYTTGTGALRVDSRLPMTANVVTLLDNDGAGCRSVAERLSLPITELAALPAGKLKSVELNFQSVRWPSTVRPDLGGHAEYFLRVFERAPEGAKFVEARLENTPDAPRILRDRKLRDELIAWVRAPESLAAIDLGTALLPDKFLAKQVTSVAPRGLGRLANRPFRQLFTARDVADLDLAKYQTIKSPAALIRRLDALSCAGCHQSRSVAGFHFLGVDDPLRAVDAIAVAMSPHLAGELARRTKYLDAMSKGRTPDELRLSAEREGAEGEFGAHCGLGDRGFSDWTCRAGLVCTAIDEGEVGACHAPRAEAGAGDPCEPGKLEPNTDAHRDRLRAREEQSCGSEAVCESTPVGFPGGMCATSCGAKKANEACGAIAILTPFNDCLAKQTIPFADCIRRHTRPAGLRRCNQAESCRDDYICTRTNGPEGTCIPPYFLFQMRVDGHRL